MAIVRVIKSCRVAGHIIIGSSAIENEILANTNAGVRTANLNFFRDTIADYINLTAADFQRADEFAARGLGYGDSLHLAVAESSGVDFLITVDNDFERIAIDKNMSTVKVINPLKFK
jgi:predicted nucleic acid-binding protein